jgi:diguanylate cyclase (GGDEF)-like protein
VAVLKGGEGGVPDLLIGGFPEAVVAALVRAFPAARLRRVDSGREVLDELERGRWALLLLDHSLAGPPAMEVLRHARLRGAPLPPVLYALGREAGGGVAHQLVDELGVHRLLYHPLDAREVAREVTSLLDMPAREPVPAPAATREELGSALAAIWERFRGTTLARVEVVEAAVVAVLEGELTPEARREAEREAHKLAGGVGTFGFAEASRAARAVELMMEGARPLEPADALRLSELVLTLRRELERPPATPAAPAPDAGRATLLVVTDDAELGERVAMEAEGRQIAAWRLADATGVRRALAERSPDAVVADLSLGMAGEAGLRLLDELAADGADRPVVVIAARDGFAERIGAARRGARAFLSRPVPPRAVVDAVAAALRLTDVAGSRVLAVDDDPQILASLRTLLEARGLTVTTLADPLRFWETLERARPDLLMVDEDMPHVSGVELCRVVRADPRWRALPVLFLTARTDYASVKRIFDARADDYASKPFAGPEIVARVESRLERVRLERTLADGSVGSGTGRRLAEECERVLAIAGRTRAPAAFAVLRVDSAEVLRARIGTALWEPVVRRVAALLRDAAQPGDVVVQSGPEELTAALYGADRDAAVQLLEGVVRRVADEEVPAPGGAIRVSLSGGVAEYPADGRTPADLRAAADDALLHAQEQGGGRVLPAGWSADAPRAEVVDVAVVDDDPALAELLRQALETRGHTTRRITDGDEALELLGGRNPALRARVVLLDVDLPGRDGFTVLRALAADGVAARTHIIMLTVRAGELEVVKALELGAADHVAKPFSIQVLMRRVQRALGTE